MAGIDVSIEVEGNARNAYDAWANFRNLPAFVKNAQEVVREGDVLHWTGRVGRTTTSWDARITHEEPGRRLAWVAPDGPIDTDITFEELDGSNRTLVRFSERMHHSRTAQLTAALGLGAFRARGDLLRFKALVEGGTARGLHGR